MRKTDQTCKAVIRLQPDVEEKEARLAQLKAEAAAIEADIAQTKATHASWVVKAEGKYAEYRLSPEEMEAERVGQREEEEAALAEWNRKREAEQKAREQIEREGRTPEQEERIREQAKEDAEIAKWNREREAAFAKSQAERDEVIAAKTGARRRLRIVRQEARQREEDARRASVAARLARKSITPISPDVLASIAAAGRKRKAAH